MYEFNSSSVSSTIFCTWISRHFRISSPIRPLFKPIEMVKSFAALNSWIASSGFCNVDASLHDSNPNSEDLNATVIFVTLLIVPDHTAGEKERAKISWSNKSEWEMGLRATIHNQWNGLCNEKKVNCLYLDTKCVSTIPLFSLFVFFLFHHLAIVYLAPRKYLPVREAQVVFQVRISHLLWC